MKKQAFELKPKKYPKQSRSQLTWHALLEATAQLLCERGYQALTTNHVAERAGVGIGTVYEYFPGKEALVAAVIDDWMRQQLQRLQALAEEIIPLPAADGVRHAVHVAYALLFAERVLIRVMLFEVPFTHELESFRTLGTQLLQVAVASNRSAAPHYRVFTSPVGLYLLNTLLGGTLLQLVLSPPADLDRDEILNALSDKLLEWTLPATTTTTSS